jgi:uroporphyrinogen III methyltransferase/synthase
MVGARRAHRPRSFHWGARPEQRVVTATLEHIADAAASAGLKNPAIIVGVSGQAARKLSWYDSRPLSGKRVVIPRAADQARDTAASLLERGRRAGHLPMIEIAAPPDPARVSAA